jgi:hypothetical protein
MSFSCEIASLLRPGHLSIVLRHVRGLESVLLSHIQQGNSKIRLKCISFLKALHESWKEQGSACPMEAMLLARLLLSCLKGLLQFKESKLQFNALLLLDEVFFVLMNPARGLPEDRV